MTAIGSFSASGILTMARGRNGDIYGVNGLQRGFRWNGTDASVEQLGISAPASAPTVATSGASPKYYVTSVQIIDPGYGYQTRPSITFDNASAVSGGAGAARAKVEVAGGSISRVTLQYQGSGYTSPPAITVPAAASIPGSSTAPVNAVLAAELRGAIVGKYWCAYRYVDDTPKSDDGPIPSSLSDYAEVEINSPVQELVWSNLSAGSEQRVSKIELWRTTADQARVFYRVAVLPSNATTFTDTLADAELSAPARSMPFTATASTDVITCTCHGLAEGDEVRFASITGGAGLSTQKTYYARDVTATTFKVAESAGGSAVDITTNATAGFAKCSSFRVMPAVLPNGQPNARRFRLPPQNKSTIVMFQDRAWYAVDAPGRKYDGTSDADHSEPNTLYFSEIDEPESVSEPNELILQDNVNGADKITALMPFGGAMVVFQERHCYRLSYAAQPVIDANFSLIAQRGCFNQRCWATHDGVAYVADSMGIYALDGSNATPLSDGIDNYWSQSLIHFASSANFFVCVDPVTRIARFYFSTTAGLPDRALCYHPVTKAWWEEQYAQRFGAAAIARSGGRQRLFAGAASGAILLADSGGEDLTVSGVSQIVCTMRTSNFSLEPNGQDRSLRVLFKPMSGTCNLSTRLHYNGSSSAKAAAVATDRGTGFKTEQGGHAFINMATDRSAIGSATGYAIAMYAGRMDDRSAGGDRHIAVELAATKPNSEGITLYGLGIQGVGQ